MSPRVYLVANHSGAEVTVLDSIAFVNTASDEMSIRVEHDGQVSTVAKGELSLFEVYVEPPEGLSAGLAPTPRGHDDLVAWAKSRRKKR